MPSSAATTSTVTVAAAGQVRHNGATSSSSAGDGSAAPVRRRQANRAPTTASAMIATSGRYMRRSAPTSVAIGRMLDVGANSRNTHAPRNPSAGRRTSAMTVATIKPTTIAG